MAGVRVGGVRRDEELKERPVEEPIKKPSTRWKARWVALDRHVTRCKTCDGWILHEKGDFYLNHCNVYPSKDIAMSKAMKLDADRPISASKRRLVGAVEVP